MNIIQLKWLVYCSEEPKLATNVSQVPQLWTGFQTRELLERASQTHLHLGWSQVSTLLACVVVSTAWRNSAPPLRSTNTLSAARSSSPSLHRLCNFLAWRSAYHDYEGT